MERPFFSVLVTCCSDPPEDPTAGPRSTLIRTLDSILASRYPSGSVAIEKPSVEILLGLDGDRPAVRAAVAAWAQRNRVAFEHAEDVYVRFREHPFAGTWGHPARNRLLEIASGRYLWGLDDDDRALPDALRCARIKLLAIEAERGAPHPVIARMRVWHVGYAPIDPPNVLWQTAGLVQEGHVGGHMLIAPNEPPLVGRFLPDDTYSADFAYVRDTLANFERAGRPAVWDDGFMADVRPP